MDGKKQVGSSSSSSSFTTELFGSKESSSTSGIFGSIFDQSSNSKVLGRESLHSGSNVKNQNFVDESCNTKSGTGGQMAKLLGKHLKTNPPTGNASCKEGESQSQQNGDTSSIYYEQRVQQPCHLSSSIYYGGQDIYCHPQGAENSTFKKDGAEDDSESASRGNWWQESLYY